MDKTEKLIQEIHSAVRSGDVQKLKVLISKAGVEASDIVGKELPRVGSALHVASRLENIEVIQTLLDIDGIGVNLPQKEGHVVAGMTPLHMACAEGNVNVVKYLIAQGADVNWQESEGQTPLHSSCVSQKVEIARMLLDNGANVNQVDNKGQSPLQMSILRAPDPFIILLIERGADIHVADKDGQTPLHYAVEWENCTLVEALLAKGAAVNQQDNNGQSPLHLAVGDEIMQLMVKYGGDVKLRDLHGKPPVEEVLDMEKEEYQAINAALSKHLEKATKHVASPEVVQNVQKRYNKLAMAPNADMAGAKSNLMSELLAKKSHGGRATEGVGTSESNSPLAQAGVLSELKSKTPKKDSN